LVKTCIMEGVKATGSPTVKVVRVAESAMSAGAVCLVKVFCYKLWLLSKQFRKRFSKAFNKGFSKIMSEHPAVETGNINESANRYHK